MLSSTKENARPREADRIHGDEKRQRFEDNGDATAAAVTAAAGAGTGAGAEADGEEGDRCQLLNVITFACRPLRHCVGSFPTVSISLKQGPGVVNRLVRHLFDSKLEALTGERDESHLWCIRDDECRRTLLSNNSRPAGGAWFDDEESRESQDANQQTLDLDHLEKGDSMHFSYDEHSHRPIFYKFTVDSIVPLVNPDEELPRCTVPASRREFTQAEKQESESYRRRREELARSGRLVCFSRNLYLQGSDQLLEGTAAEPSGLAQIDESFLEPLFQHGAQSRGPFPRKIANVGMPLLIISGMRAAQAALEAKTWGLASSWLGEVAL